jgi:hypothetical protein
MSRHGGTYKATVACNDYLVLWTAHELALRYEATKEEGDDSYGVAFANTQWALFGEEP